MERIPHALDLFGEKVHAVVPDAWANGTPCSEWDVRDVVNHMTSEHLWAADLLGGCRWPRSGTGTTATSSVTTRSPPGTAPDADRGKRGNGLGPATS